MTTSRDTLYDEKAERSVIGSLLIEPAAFSATQGIVQGNDFYLESCRYAFEAAQNLGRTGMSIDPTTLEAELVSQGHWNSTGLLFLSECQTVTESALHADNYAAIVADFSKRRRVYDTAQSLTRSIFSADGMFGPGLALAAQELSRMSAPPDEVRGADRFGVTWFEEAMEPQPSEDFIIAPWLPTDSVGLVYGTGGSAKTYMLLDLAVAVAQGTSWMGQQVTRGGLVLVVDEESGPHRIARRLQRIAKSRKAESTTPVGYISLAGLNMTKEEDAAQLGAVIEGHGPRLVIIDALADVSGGANENDTGEMQPIFNRLRLIASKNLCCILVIHHLNKKNEYRGTTAMQAAVDLMAKVTLDKVPGYLTFETEKLRDEEDVKFCATCSWADDGFTMTPENPTEREKPLSPGEEYVIRYLTAHTEASMDEIEGSADTCSANVARKAVFSLTTKNKARRLDAGGRGSKAVYGLT
jgi:hypothetical protein